MSKNIRRTVLIAAAALVVIGIAVIAAILNKAAPANQTMLVIDGAEIKETEYRWAMFSARNDVLAELTKNGISPVYWDMQTDSGVPYEMVAERAVEILQEYYAISSLAVEHGYLENASFEALEDQIKAENEDRAEAIAAGEIVTGLSGYDLNQYIQENK